MASAPQDAAATGSIPVARDLARLFQRSAHGVRLGLDATRAVLREMGEPQDAFKAVHIAGTNGKGSVAVMIESVLRASGYVTGLYTSPHLVAFNERIRVCGRCISDEELWQLMQEVDRADQHVASRPGMRRTTFFEFTTAIAFEHFRRQGVEVAVLETGLGGRLDATNVVTPLLSVITSIALDHTGYLGDTVAKVAEEKCGIIKPGRPVICGPRDEESTGVIHRVAHANGSAVVDVQASVSIRRIEQSFSGQRIKVEADWMSAPPFVLPLLGPHQLENAAIAVSALGFLAQTSFRKLTGRTLRRGLEEVVWPARLQVLSESPRVLLDGAHNPAGAAALLDSLEELLGDEPLGVVVNFSREKDCHGVMKVLAARASRCWVATIEHDRMMEPGHIEQAAEAAGVQARVCPLSQAMDESYTWASTHGGVVCITGSVYLAGAVLDRDERLSAVTAPRGHPTRQG